MLDWVSNAFSSVNAAREITNSLLTLRDAEMVRHQVFDLTSNLMDLQQQMMSAQIEQMALIKRIAELESELVKVKNQTDKREHYERHVFESGYFAYKLKPDFEAGNIEHYLCSNCFERGDLVTLQVGRNLYWSGLKCPRCETSIALTDSEIKRKSSYYTQK